ncbi:hypothetical protein [Kiloniella antarctica]|uniref:Lipoprotein n=1 Tax=Kiloniella antarctica TaxID=1550907 RepID=A0ABW5BDV8_9PROT
MKILFIFVAALIMTSCGPLPRPFIDQQPQNNPLLQLSGTRPIAVELPLFSIPAPKDQITDLALWAQEILSEDIRKQGFPAAGYAPAENSLHIISHFNAANTESLTTELRMDISVTETSIPNEAIIVFSEQTNVPTSLLSKSPKPLINELLQRAAQRLSVEIIALDKPDQKKPNSNTDLLIALQPFPDTLSPPTQKVLKTELKTSLRLRGYKLVEQQDSNNQYTLKLDITPFQKENNFFLTLSWIVADYKTGEEVGIIEQTNPVPNIPLSRIIIPVSEAISEGVAVGIEDLLLQNSHQNQTVLK